MSEWRLRQPSEKKDSLIAKIVVYLCLILVPAGLGGATAAFYYLVPSKHGSMSRSLTKIAMQDRKPAMKRRFKLGAIAGGIFGAGACVYFTVVTRKR